MCDRSERLAVLDKQVELLDQIARGTEEATRGTQESDSVRLGLQIGNFIAAAVYGHRGEFRVGTERKR